MGPNDASRGLKTIINEQQGHYHSLLALGIIVGIFFAFTSFVNVLLRFDVFFLVTTLRPTIGFIAYPDHTKVHLSCSSHITCPGGGLPYLTRRDVLLNRVSFCGKDYATGYCNW